ncbi:MAG: hypothetical protein WBG94_08195 [Anaerolineales bacterium]
MSQQAHGFLGYPAQTFIGVFVICLKSDYQYAQGVPASEETGKMNGLPCCMATG